MTEYTRRVNVGVGVLVRRGDEILLMKRANAHGAGTWSTPGGHIDFGESPEACAARETQEETGISITNISFKGITNDLFADEEKHYITIWMTAEYASGEARIGEEREMTEVAWFHWDHLPVPLFVPLQNLLNGTGYFAGRPLR